MNLKSTFAGAALAAAAGLALAPVAFADQKAASTDNGKHASAAVTATINPAGHVLVRGAVVTGISSTTLSAKTSWGSSSLTWNVAIASSTELLGAKSGRISLADIKAGDTLSFQGPLDSSGNLTVNARVIRDTSLSGTVMKIEKPRLIEGKLQAISGSMLTLLRGNSTITVNVGSTTEVKKKNFSVTDLGSLKIGDKIRVLGIGTSTIEASIVRNSSR